MPTREEIWRSLYGAWRIARLDPQAMSWFDQSAEGFWNSFAALPLALVPYLLALFLSASGETMAAVGGPVAYLLFQILDFVAGWLGFLLLMLPVTWALRLTANYGPFVVASNWASLLAMALMLPSMLLLGGATSENRGAVMIATAVGITLMFYSYLVARAALRSSILVSIGVVMIELAVTLLVGEGVHRLAAALSPAAGQPLGVPQ